MKLLKLKEKVEKKNDTIQGRLLNDIIRHKINTYDELNEFLITNISIIKIINLLMNLKKPKLLL